MIGLPVSITACLFDLDGVLTDTAAVHREAWKHTFDEFLRRRDGASFEPFTEQDYLEYVDGLPRSDGVRQFLRSRGLELPEGDSTDSAETAQTAQTVAGVGNRKNVLVQRIIAERGVDAYPGSLAYLRATEQAGLAIGVVTSSANAAAVLEAAGITPFVRARIDGNVLRRHRLRGKPYPDSFVAGARELGVDVTATAVFEDAFAGVQAGKAGGFGYVVGVDRTGAAEQLRHYGADVVVDDLATLLGPEQERP